MKKFMIFLLMAFLYIGTCQARSESAHPNDAQLKLLSWVSPTPSQSFMTRSVTDDVSEVVSDLVELKVDGNTESATGIVDQVFDLALNPNQAAAVVGQQLSGQGIGYNQLLAALHVDWYVNDELNEDLDNGTGLNALASSYSPVETGEYDIYAVVTFPGISQIAGNTYPSNHVTVYVGTDGPADEPDCSYTLRFDNNISGAQYQGNDLSEQITVYNSDVSSCYFKIIREDPNVEFWMQDADDFMIAAHLYGSSTTLSMQLESLYDSPYGEGHLSVGSSHTVNVYPYVDANDDDYPDDDEICGETQSVTFYIDEYYNPDDQDPYVDIYGMPEDPVCNNGNENVVAEAVVYNDFNISSYSWIVYNPSSTAIITKSGPTFNTLTVSVADRPVGEYTISLIVYGTTSDGSETSIENTVSFTVTDDCASFDPVVEIFDVPEEVCSTENFTVVAQLSGVDAIEVLYQVTIDGTLYGDPNSNGSFSLPASDLSIGMHQVNVEVNGIDEAYGPFDGIVSEQEVLMNVTECSPQECDYAWIQDQGATAQELTTTFEAGSTINWEFEVSNGGWTESITWYLDDESSTPIGFADQLNYTLPSTISLGEHTISVQYNAYNNEADGFYIDWQMCPKEITITVTEGQAPEIDPEGLCEDAYPDAASIVYSIDQNSYIYTGDGSNIDVVLNVPQEISIGDVVWSVLGYEGTVTSQGGVETSVSAPTQPGSYAILAEFPIVAVLDGDLNDQNWIALNDPYPCAAFLNFIVPEPSADPCDAVIILANGSPVDVIELHQGEEIVMPLSISEEAIENVDWSSNYPDFTSTDVTAVVNGPSATTAAGEYYVTADFELWGIEGIDATPIQFDAPVPCTKTITIRVLGNDEPTPTPTPEEEHVNVFVEIEGNTSACADDQVTLFAHPLGTLPVEPGFPKYTWFVNGNVPENNATAQQPYFTFVPSETFLTDEREIMVELAYQNCVEPAHDVINFNILTNPEPLVMSINVDTVCVGGQITASIVLPNAAEEVEEPSEDQNPNYSMPDEDSPEPIAPPAPITSDELMLGDEDVASVAEETITEDLIHQPIYKWYLNGLEIPGEHMGEITLNMPVAGQYVLSVSYAQPVCGSLSMSNTDTVTVIDVPAMLTITGDNVICQNATATMTATEIAGATYTWAGPDAAAAAETSNVLTTTIPGVYAVTATMGDFSGCAAMAEFTVYQFGGDLQVTADQMNVCPGTTVMMNANLDGWNNENISYLWSNDSTSSTIAAVVNETTTYTVTAFAQAQTQASNGEEGDEEDDPDAGVNTVEDHSAVCQLTSSITINVITNQNILTTVEELENTSFCVGQQVTLRASSTVETTSEAEEEEVVEEGEPTPTPVAPAAENEPTYTYVWYKNGIVIPGENQPEITVNLNQAGSYSFSAKAVAGDCNTSEVSNLVTVNVEEVPTVTITGTHELAQGQTSATLNVSVLPTDGSYIYSWSDGTEGPEATSITVEQAGVYTVTVTYGNGCQVISAPFQVNTVAPFDIVPTGDPNPCYGENLTIHIDITDQLGGCDNIEWQVNGQFVDEYIGADNPIFDMSTVTLYQRYGLLEFMLTALVSCDGSCLPPTPINIPVEITVPVNLDKIVVLNNGEEAHQICEGAQLDLSVKVKGEEGEASYEDNSLTYVWTRNGVVIPGVNGPRFSEQAWIYDSDPMTYVYTVFVVYGNGCQSVPVGSDTVYVRRNPIVTIDGNPNVCYFGDNINNVNLVAWVDGIQDLDATYRWFESGHLMSNPSGSANLYKERHQPTYLNPYIFTVEVVNGNGCTTISDPFYVNVYEAPVVNITGDAEAICTTGSVTLQANLNNYNDPMLTFQWYADEVDNNHILEGATHEVQEFYPTQPTNYIVQVQHLMVYTNMLNYNTDYCTAYDTFHVDIQGIPVVTVENDLNGEDTICEGRSITMHAHVSGGIPGVAELTWFRNGELIENFHDSLFVDAPLTVDGYPTTYIYSVIVNQGLSGCESELTYFDTITVNPNPAIQLVTDPIICVSEPDVNNITLVANMDEVPSGVQYRWLEDNNEMAVTTENTYSLHKDFSENPYNFSVQVVNDYGCTGQSDATVYVNEAPVVHITVTDTMVCEGGQITLNAALNDWNSDALTYMWYDGDQPISDATTLSYTTVPALNPAHHYYHIAIEQSTSGCQAGSDTIDVEVVARPAITSITEVGMPENREVCDGFQVNLTANVEGGIEGGEVFTWYRNGVEIEGATQATYTEIVSALNGETTTYNYAVSVAQSTVGCVSDIYNDLDSIVVNPNPVLELVTNPIVCNDEGDNITLTANLNPEMEGAAFRWLEDNVEMDPSTYTVNGNSITLHKDYRYQPYSFGVELVNDYGCTAAGTAQVYVNAAPVVNIVATDTIVCEGGSLTLTANLDNWNATELTYRWYDGENELADGTDLEYVVTPTLGEHHYHLHIDQLSSGCQAESNVIDVLVTGVPVIASVEPSQLNVCYGGQIAITATPADGNMPGDTYTWYRNGIEIEGATAATIYDAPEVVDNNTQQYNYTAILTRPVPGCTSEAVTSAFVTVYPNPVVVITGDQHVCETDSVFLIANVDTTGYTVGGLHYTWYESGQIRDNMAYNLGDNNFYAEYMYARTEPYRYTVDVWRNIPGAGCIAHSEEFLVYVYPQPVVNITATETEICENGQVTLTANLNDYNATDLIYQWYTVGEEVHELAVDYTDSGYVYAYDTVSVRYNIPGATSATYTTTLTETTTLGVMILQTPSTCTANDEITITVNPIPVVTAVTVDPAVVCDGAQVTVEATIEANGTEGEPVYTWFRNGVLIEGANQATLQENVYTNDNHVTVNTYNAIVTLPASGCVSQLSVNPGTVTIKPAPSTVTISGINTLCENDTTTLTAYSDVEGIFVWSTGDTATSIVVPAGSYTVTMITPEGCEMTSENFTVEAFGTDLLVSASETAICRGEHTTLYVDQEGWQGNVTYLWDAQAGNSVATTVDVQPDSTTTYHVTATVSSTNGSCTAEGEVTIIVHQLPAQLVVTPTDTLICEGDQISFLATEDPSITAYIWYQNGVEIPGENQSVLTVNFNEMGNYTFAAKAISVDGCVSAEASEPVTIRVNPAPTTVTITGHNVLCMTDSTVLTAHSDVPGVFTWNDGTIGPNLTVAAGVYNVTITTPEGCHLTSENFTVESFGTDLLVSATATSICQGEHTTLYVDQDGWQGDVTYLWDAQAGNSVATTVDVQPEVTTTYHVTATVANENGTCTAEGEVTIIVHPLPVIASVTASETTICQGDQVTFTATGDSTTTAYIWYANGVEIPGENQATLTVNFNETGIYNYAVKAISNENCIAAVAVEAPAVTVKPAPTTVTITGNNVLCLTDSTILTAHSDVEGVFTWNDGTVGPNLTVAAGVYNVTITTPEGCHLTSENFTVESFGTDLLVSATATSICQGEHTTLYVDQEGWQGNVTYAWDAQAGNSIATTVDVQPDVTTTYHVTATVANENGTCTAEGEVTIIVHPLPVIASVTASETTICQGDQVTFTATGDSTTTAYIWYANGVEIPGENQATLTVNFNETGIYNYAVKAISNENCLAAVAVDAPAVTVKPAPTTVTITGNNVLCMTDSTILTAHSDVEGTFTWNDGTVGPNLTVAAGVYNVTITTPEGCHLTSDNFTVESFGTDMIVSATATSICQGEHTTLSVDQNGWQGNVTYAWDAQAGNSIATTVDVQPDVTTTYHVTATVVAESGSCTAEGEITIIVNPLPVVAAVTATDTVVCEGTQVTFVATGDANTTAYIWYNNGVEIPGENQAALTVNFNEQGVYNYAVKAISNEGCVSAVAFDAPVVTVNAAPESVTISGNTMICDGGSTTLYANVVPNLPASYTWFKDNIQIGINTNTDNIVVTEAGSYKVVAAFNGCTTESDAVVVTVEQAPQLQLTAEETVFCAGGSTVITAEATGWNNADVNYNWSNGFHGSAYTFNAEYAGDYTFYVTASQATSGCVAVDSITINVNELPATPVVTVDNAVVCDGGQVTLTITNPNMNAVYTWYRNGVVIAGANGAILTESPTTVDGDATNYVYTVVAELPMSGCTSLVSANTIVTVIPTPVVAVSVEGNTTICQGGTTILHANVTPANANYSYQWYKDNVLIEGATAADYTVAEDARETAYNFSVVVTANAGCNVTAYAPAITVVADPVVEATISNNISCVGGTATLTAIVNGGVAGVNGLNGYTFEWFRNVANNDDPNNPYSTTEFVGNASTYTTSTADAVGNYSYWVTVTSNYGCQSTSAPVVYSVVADPVVTIAVAQGYPQTVCNGGASMLTANVTGGYGEVAYQWYKNGNLLVGETNQTLNLASLAYGDNDTYMVEVTQTGVGCSNSASAALNTLVTVAPTYTVDITGFGNVCEGGTLTLTATVNNILAGDVLSYQWYRIHNGGEAVAISGANAAQYSTSDLLLGNSYDYYVVVTSNISGCSVVSNSVPANVVPAPTVAIQGANTVCEGGDLTLNAFVSGGVDGEAYTYTWNWTGAATGSATTAVPSYVPTVAANDAATPYYFTVTISRNDNSGCTATSEAHEVNVMAVPTVSVTADNNYVCQNGEVTFTAHVSPAGSYNYVWTINGSQQAVNASTVTTSISTVGTITASVVVSAVNASGSCSASAEIATAVQVVAAPTVTIAADHTTMCVGGTTTLTSNINANSNIPSDFNYQWAINGIEVPGAIASTFVQPLNAAGEYVYTLRVSQNNNLGCSSTWSAPVTVQVAEQPVVALNSEDGLSICEGGSITMTGVVTNYGNTVNGVTNSSIYGAMTFDWTSNGVNVHHNTNITNAQNQITETLNTVGIYNYQVMVTPAGYNCQPQVSNIHVVNVVGDPSWTEVHVYSNNGTDACLGEMVTLAAAIQGGVTDGEGSTSGHIQWTVLDENGNTMNVSGGLGGFSYDIPAAAGTYIYIPTFVGNIGNGCQLTNTNDVQVAVTVHELPTATFISGDGTSICANDPSASAALVIGFTGVAPFTYEVVDNHGNVIAHATTMANTATIYVAPTEQTTYRLTLIQDAYCENTAFGEDAVATVYVNSIEFDTTVFESGCDNPGYVTISFNMISGNPNATFTVVYDNGYTASGNIVNNTATFGVPTTVINGVVVPIPGDYDVVFTVDGCSYDIVVRVLVSEFAFGDGSTPIMDQRWNDVVVVNNNPATNGGHTFVGFQWYKNGVAIPGAVYSNYQEDGGLNGFYSVTLIEQDANGNSVTYKTCEMYFNSVSAVKVYPVPANVRQEITIELDLTADELEGAVLDIFNVNGALVDHVTNLQPITKIEGFKAQGTYFGRILTGTNEIKTVKFIIVK